MNGQQVYIRIFVRKQQKPGQRAGILQSEQGHLGLVHRASLEYQPRFASQ